MTPKVAVVIPFYQEETGILSCAVKSVLAEGLPDELEIIVVDDGSPKPARKELDILSGSKPPIRIIERRNGGAGAARNTGLDHVSQYVEYVAFLDSDDVWTAGHLRNALNALDRGFDLYFADCREKGERTSHFKGHHAKIVNTFSALDFRCDLLMPSGAFFTDTIAQNVIATSSVVYRYRKFPGIRFTEWRNGQDFLFWLDLLYRTRAVICSTKTEFVFGHGVNIYRSAKPGTVSMLLVLRSHIMIRKDIQRKFTLSQEQVSINNEQMRKKRKAFVRCSLSGLRSECRQTMFMLLGQVIVDPLTFGSLLHEFVRTGCRFMYRVRRVLSARS